MFGNPLLAGGFKVRGGIISGGPNLKNKSQQGPLTLKSGGGKSRATRWGRGFHWGGIFSQRHFENNIFNGNVTAQTNKRIETPIFEFLKQIHIKCLI